MRDVAQHERELVWTVQRENHPFTTGEKREKIAIEFLLRSIHRLIFTNLKIVENGCIYRRKWKQYNNFFLLNFYKQIEKYIHIFTKTIKKVMT